MHPLAFLPQPLDGLFNGPARYAVSHHFSDGAALVFVLCVLAAQLVAGYVLLLAALKCLLYAPALLRACLRALGIGKGEIPQAFLELTFPTDTMRSAYATEQLHIVLRGLLKYTSVWDRWAARKQPYSLELVGTRDDGIRYVIMVPKREAEAVQRNLGTFLPGLKVHAVKDYLAQVADTTVGAVELELGNDFVLPLKDHRMLSEHDVIGYIAGHMSQLATGDLVAYQIVAVPVLSMTHHRVTRRRHYIERRIARGHMVGNQLKPQRSTRGQLLWLLWYPPLWFVAAMGKVFIGATQIVGALFSRQLPDFMRGNHDKRSAYDPYEYELAGAIKGKLDQQLFEVSIRVLVASSDVATIQRRLDALVSSLQPLNTSHQAICVRQGLPVVFHRHNTAVRFRERVLSPHYLSQQVVLSAVELAGLYHFPNTGLTKTEGLVKSRSKQLASPLSMKRTTAELDVVVGSNNDGGSEEAIGLTLAQRQKHTYVIGKTGTGKTTLLTSMIYQDMVNGKGLAVLDPHGDMFRELLRLVPAHRLKDVVIFDPSDREWPLGLNLLDPGITFANKDEQHEWITSAVLAVFAKLADEKLWGPRMEHILRSAVLTALELPNPSLYVLQRLLTEKSYQRAVSKTLTDPVLKQFWAKEFKLLGTMQLSSATAPLTHRLGHFITTKLSRHILLQEKTTLRITDIMDEGKILLVNLSKGDIGEDQSFFFGTILTSLIWMAAYQRTKVPETERKDFFLYVDEFQNFATPQFTAIASEGRKFHIPLILSHQNVAQVADERILKIVAGNAGSLVCFRASPGDEAFILPYMRPEVEQGDIVNLPPHHFYMKTTTDQSEAAFSGVTVPVTAQRSAVMADKVIGSSRAQYASPVRTVERQVGKLLAYQRERLVGEDRAKLDSAATQEPATHPG